MPRTWLVRTLAAIARLLPYRFCSYFLPCIVHITSYWKTAEGNEYSLPKCYKLPPRAGKANPLEDHLRSTSVTISSVSTSPGSHFPVGWLGLLWLSCPLTNQMQLYPIPAFIFVVDISGQLHPAEVSLTVAPGQIVNPDGKVLVPRVAEQFVLVFVADGSLAELAGALTNTLENYRAIVRFLDPPNGSESPVKCFVGVCESTGEDNHLPEFPSNIRWDVNGPAIGLHT